MESSNAVVRKKLESVEKRSSDPEVPNDTGVDEHVQPSSD